MHHSSLSRFGVLALLMYSIVGTQAQGGPPSPAASAASSFQVIAAAAQMASDPVSGQVATLQDTVTKVATSVDKLVAKSNEKDYTPAMLGFLGVVLGVIIAAVGNYFIQKKIMSHQLVLASDKALNDLALSDKAAASAAKLAETKAVLDSELTERKSAQDSALAEKRSKLEIGKSVVDSKQKQLSELYGPLSASFGQSNAIYRVMNGVLASKRPDKFRLTIPPKDDPKRAPDLDGYLFEIRLGTEVDWIRFRTVLHIDHAYSQGYDAEIYFDQFVEIAARIVSTIETKAGLARADQQLDETEGGIKHKFGQYLAHAAILRAVHVDRKAKMLALTNGLSVSSEVADSKLTDLSVHSSAVFPQGIQKLVDDGYSALQRDIADWERRASEHSKGM